MVWDNKEFNEGISGYTYQTGDVVQWEYVSEDGNTRKMTTPQGQQPITTPIGAGTWPAPQTTWTTFSTQNGVADISSLKKGIEEGETEKKEINKEEEIIVKLKREQAEIKKENLINAIQEQCDELSSSQGLSVEKVVGIAIRKIIDAMFDERLEHDLTHHIKNKNQN